MKIEDGRKARRILCEKYDLKCLTQKCPFAKWGCYAYDTFDQFYTENVGARKKIAEKVEEVLNEANNQG